jgi:nucleoside 2-deoxyribosyltransferase
MSSVYLSARFGRKHELQRYAEELGRLGIEVTSRWLSSPTPELTDEAWLHLAATDKADVERAEALVLFAEPDRDGGGGRHVEFGMALALGKRVIVLGAVENLFQRLREVAVVANWPDARELLISMSMSAAEVKPRLESM